MGITNSDKTLSVSSIECGQSFQVRLSLTAEPSIMTHPVDIVMVLDRSGSMAGSPLANLKNGAKKFIDIIDEATDSAQDGQIGGGSRIGIVSFADTAKQDTQLITSVSQLRAAVDALQSGGRTNHADAFTKALQLFDAASQNERIIVLFTDGRTTAGTDAAPIAQAAKAQGVIIYAIGLSGNGGIDEQALEAWASEPASSYVAITPDDEELEKLFGDLAQNISKPGAREIVITETVNPCFQITAVSNPNRGTASLTGPTSLQWKIDALGVGGSEGATLEFTVRHVGSFTGEMEVNESVKYTDKDGNHVTFPNPKITVHCGSSVQPEPCPEPVNITVDGCEDALEFDAGNLALESLGRVLQLNVTLKNICPRKRVALAVVLTEVDKHGVEHDRGLKTVTIPAHTRTTCQDITVRCIKFVLPEDLDVSGGSSNGICGSRHLRARLFANYIDNDFSCCEAVS